MVRLEGVFQAVPKFLRSSRTPCMLLSSFEYVTYTKSIWNAGCVHLNRTHERRSMKLRRRNPFLIPAFTLILCVSSVSCSKSPQASQDPNSTGDKPGVFSRIFNSTTPVTVQEGTDLTVVLDQTISTARNRSGESFRATVADPVVIDGKTVIPKDSLVMGHIVESVPSGRLKGVAKLGLTLESIEINGKSYDIATA